MTGVIRLFVLDPISRALSLPGSSLISHSVTATSGAPLRYFLLPLNVAKKRTTAGSSNRPCNNRFLLFVPQSGDKHRPHLHMAPAFRACISILSLLRRWIPDEQNSPSDLPDLISSTCNLRPSGLSYSQEDYHGHSGHSGGEPYASKCS